ncbi:MAG: CaiB/BaiF CoA transferase family protein [Burkholderiales bacterium]
MTFKPFASALSDLTVLDLTGARSGPTAARQFADWGANVIRIEPASEGGFGNLGRRHAADFQNLHRNKRSLAVDLKAEEGREIILKLARNADVVLENFRPDVKRRLRLDYPALNAVNAGIVLGSISGFGQAGPYANRPGLDQIAQGMGGHMMLTGEPGRGPMRSGAAITDVFAGILLCNGVLTALHERNRSGMGQWVHTSLLQAQIFLLDFQAARWTMSGDLPGQEGNNHANIVPMGVFRASDGYVNIAPLPAMWEKCCEALGLQHLANHHDYATQDARKLHREALLEMMNTKTEQQDCAYWIELLNRASIPCGPVYTVQQTFDDPHVQQLGMTESVYSEALGHDLCLVGQPIGMNRSPTCIMSPAPECGEHTAEILAGIGYSDAQISDLNARKIILALRR